MLAPKRRRLPPPEARAPLPAMPRHTASSHRLLCKRKDAFRPLSLLVQGARFNTVLKKLGTAQDLSSAENPSISLATGDAASVGREILGFSALDRSCAVPSFF